MRIPRLAPCVATALALWVTRAAALDGDASGLTLIGRALEGNPRCVLTEGSTAYVGLDTGLAVVDIASPAAPRLIGHLPLPSPVMGLARTPAALLAAAGESGLHVIDVAVPAAPAVTGSLPLPGARCVAAQGVVACVGRDLAGSFGVSLVDLSGPPSLVGFAPLANGVESIAISGTTAWAGLGTEISGTVGLQAIDISTPAAPSVSGFLPTLRPVNGIALSGATAFLATGVPLRGDLVVADVASAASPAQLSRLGLGDSARGVALDGTIALVAASRLGLVRFDVTDPATPVRVDGLPTGRESVGVAAAPGLALLADRSSAGIAALSLVAAPRPPGAPGLSGLVPFAEATDVALDGGLLLALRREGLHVLDPASSLADLGTFRLPTADFSALAADAALAAIAEGALVHLVDVSVPTAPTERSALVMPAGAALDLALSGGVLYAATGRTVEIFDVAMPSSPVPLGTWDSGEQELAVAVDGTLAAAGGDTLVRMLDVTDPSLPVGLGSVTFAEPIGALGLAGGLLVACGVTTTFLVDVSSPAAPTIVGQVPIGASDADLVGGFAFLAARTSGVRVVDVSVPASPLEIAFLDTSGDAVGVASDGASIGLATSSAQVWWLDCAACVSGCRARASLDGPVPACEGLALPCDAGASTLTGCTGQATYRWFVDGTEAPGATAATFDAGPLGPGPHDVDVEVSCDTDPACADRQSLRLDVTADLHPVLDPASLRVRKVAGGDELSWIVASGSGEVNVHRSLLAPDLAAAAISPASLVAVAAGTTHVSTFSPGLGGCAFFKVFGRSSCDGSSVLP